MKKKILSLLIFLTSTLSFAETIKFIIPDGLPALSVVKLMENNKTIKGIDIDYKIEKSSDSLVMNMLKKEGDIAIVPSNFTAQLYNKGLEYKILGTVGWGSFYIVSREDIVSLKDLENKKIYTFGKGLTPDIVLQTLLKENGVDTSKLEINYLNGGNELVGMFIAKKANIIVIPEPMLSKVLSKVKDAKINFNLNEIWKANFGSIQGFPQSTLVVKNSILIEKPEFIETLTQEMLKSSNFINDSNIDKTEFIKKANITIDTSLLDMILSRANIKYIDINQSKTEYYNYFKTLYKVNPKVVGGIVPDEKIFK